MEKQLLAAEERRKAETQAKIAATKRAEAERQQRIAAEKRGAAQEPWSVERVLEPAPNVERSADGDWLVRHVRPANAV